MRATLPAALAVCAAAVMARAGGPADLAAQVPGRWRGVVTARGFAFHHLVRLKRQGRGLAGRALVWAGLTEAEAVGAARGQRPDVGAEVFAFALVQECEAVFRDDVLALSGGRVRPCFRRLADYRPFTFSGVVERPGLLAARATDGAGTEGLVHLWQEGAFARPPPLRLAKGRVHRLACRHTDRYHYTLYVPRGYRAEAPAPVLVNFSPGGNGQPLSRKMAEELGWIMVGLTESRNGPVQPSVENRDAVLFDLRRRVAVHPRRLYFSGCSGGARMASWSAASYPEWCAGMVCIAAGFLQGRPPLHQPVFFITGETDMNRKEVTALHAAERAAGRRTRLVVHPGGHSWGRPEDHEAALRWLDGLWQEGPRQRPR